MQTKLSKILAGVGLGIILVSGIFAFVSYNDYSDKMTEYAERYAQLQEDYEVSLQTMEQISEQDVEEQVHSVKDIGVKIANDANRLQVLASTGHLKSGSYDEKVTREEQSEIATRMVEYFGSNSILQSTWFSGDATQMNNQNAWTFMNSYDFSENTISVLWLCYDGTGNVVAFVTADYHADTNSFDNVARHMTTIGYTYVPATGDDGITSNENVVDNVNQLTDNAGLTEEQQQQQEEALNDEEWQDAKEENNAAKDQLKNAEGGGN